MKKNVYSLVLSESVVEEIDRLAYAMHTNRSSLINRILAERVCCVTPEMRMQSIFEEFENLLSGSEGFQVQTRPSPSVLQLRSALSFKYNPTVRYSLEFDRNSFPAAGRLRVCLRTQNTALMLYMVYMPFVPP